MILHSHVVRGAIRTWLAASGLKEPQAGVGSANRILRFKRPNLSILLLKFVGVKVIILIIIR